jgi:hypothetical protein
VQAKAVEMVSALVKEDAAKVAAFEQKKKNPDNRRMATVASVYSVDPHVRTAEDVTSAMFRDELPDKKPKAKRRRTRTRPLTSPKSLTRERMTNYESAGFTLRWPGSSIK